MVVRRIGINPKRVNPNSVLKQGYKKGRGGFYIANNARSVKPLLTALKDNDAMVRGRAALAFGEWGKKVPRGGWIRADPEVKAALKIALNDEDESVRENASWALVKLGYKV